MKTIIKTGFIALLTATTFAACSGNNSTHVPDSTRVDTAVTDSSPTGGGGADANGAPGAIDSGLDKSGSGGTDTVKKGG